MTRRVIGHGNTGGRLRTDLPAKLTKEQALRLKRRRFTLAQMKWYNITIETVRSWRASGILPNPPDD
jgi:hypothetical protein